MARASYELVQALQVTVARLAAAAGYQWGHLGMCNCGHLVQAVCAMPPAQIHRAALEREGDWEALANAYCPTSGYAIDDIITQLLDAGLTTADLGHLEKLNDPVVLAALAGGPRWLRRNDRADLIAYLDAWSALLAAELPALQRAA